MSSSKYRAEVLSVGALTQEFVDSGMLVLFGAQAPDELHDFAIIHTHGDLQADVVVGDHFVIGEQSWSVLCVGDVANQNLRNLGHVVVKFNGCHEPELPGDISLPEGAAPQITAGTIIQFVAQ